ncbi:MAG: DUF5677 domain-containing protein [Bryobacteraceae bacterium]
MAIRFLTVEQHRRVVSQLLDLGRSGSGASVREAGAEYTSLMVCFLLHNLSAAESLLRLWQAFGEQWFPATVGYIAARSIFETDVTAHYISQQPNERARQYILFEHILDKQQMDTCAKHRNSKDPQWSEGMRLMWQNHWVPREQEVNAKYNEVRSRFQAAGGGKARPPRNWSGKTIREMAVAVEHEEAYDVFYAELSSFTHVDVRLANRFLRLGADGMSWSQRAREFDVGNVFRHAASFLTCYLGLFGRQLGAWDAQAIEKCWNVEES